MGRNGVVSRRMRSGKIDDDVDQLEPSDSSHEVHVLAVDDSLVDRKVIERLLRISSCKVTSVDSGRRALQFLGLDDEDRSCDDFDGLKVDLIITDYCMPEMTGYELLKKIKESSVLREIPVVIMSSENVVARIDRCLEEGAEDFLVKPVKLSDVKRLKDYMFGDHTVKNLDREGTHKRKSPETSDLSSSPSPPLNLSSPQSLISSSDDSDSSLSSSPPLLNISSSWDPLSLPCSPTSSLESPTRRLKMSNCN